MTVHSVTYNQKGGFNAKLGNLGNTLTFLQRTEMRRLIPLSSCSFRTQDKKILNKKEIFA